LVETATKCLATASSPSAPTSHARALRALVSVSMVVKVFELTMVVPLPAAAEIEDAVAAVGVAQRREPACDLADGGVPVDDLEAAVGAPAQGVGHTFTLRQHPGPARQWCSAGVLVVVEAERLLTGVALRRRVALVATDALEPPAVLQGPQTDLDAAVALAGDAGRLPPRGRVGRGRCLGHCHGGNLVRLVH
jgi:hypothetical protein